MDAANDFLLFEEFSAKLDHLASEGALARVMGEILRCLLRRQGDAEFLTIVQDAFVAGMAGRGLDGQKVLAREVIRVVIELRPEIAQAWQILYGTGEPSLPHRRRAADRMPLDTALPADGATSFHPARSAAEHLTALFVGEVIDRRLKPFQIAAPPLPSIAYCHAQPFFLFTQAFCGVVRDFVTGVLMEDRRDALERDVYSGLTPIMAQSDAVESFLAGSQPKIWGILGERLGQLAALHHSVEAKLANGAVGGAGTEGREVEIPVSQPRVWHVLGIRFTLGSWTGKRKVRMEDGAGGGIEPAEMEALELLTRFRDMAASAGLELPDACDFGFLRLLLDFDAGRFALALKEVSALAGHAKLPERLRALDGTLPGGLVDVLVLMLFFRHGDGGFGFRELCEAGAGTAREAGGPEVQRPFIRSEVARRPRELAFQFREALRQRRDVATVEAAARMLATVWQAMPNAGFAKERDAALTVFTAFPVAFANDPDEPVFSEISHVFYRTLTSDSPDFERCLLAVATSYGAIAARQGT